MVMVNTVVTAPFGRNQHRPLPRELMDDSIRSESRRTCDRCDVACGWYFATLSPCGLK